MIEEEIIRAAFAERGYRFEEKDGYWRWERKRKTPLANGVPDCSCGGLDGAAHFIAWMDRARRMPRSWGELTQMTCWQRRALKRAGAQLKQQYQA